MENQQAIYRALRNISLIIADIEREVKDCNQETKDMFLDLDASYEMFLDTSKKFFEKRNTITAKAPVKV